MGCEAGPTLNWTCVGRPTSCVQGRATSRDKRYRYSLNECWPAPAMVVEAIYVEDIF